MKSWSSRLIRERGLAVRCEPWPNPAQIDNGAIDATLWPDGRVVPSGGDGVGDADRVPAIERRRGGVWRRGVARRCRRLRDERFDSEAVDDKGRWRGRRVGSGALAGGRVLRGTWKLVRSWARY